MKKNRNFKIRFKQILVLIVAVFGIFLLSCEDDKKNLLNDFEIGGFVRFEVPFPTVVDVSDLSDIPGVTIETTLEAPDKNVVSYSMEVSATIGGEFYDYVSFGSEITSFPNTITISIVDIADALEIDIDAIDFGDTFDFKGTAVNDKGIVYSSERQDYEEETGKVSGGNNSDDLLDELGYRNAFEFGFAIPCPPETGDIVGDWTIYFEDLYGDGWDGAFITVEIDGVSTDYTLNAGSSGTEIVNVPAGTTVLRFSYTAGSYEEEHVYTIETPTGEIIGPNGPNPSLCIR